MITVITGLTGSGKTWLMSRKMLKEYKSGIDIYTNFPVYFPDDNRIFRFNSLSETYHIKNGLIAIDEGQKLFNARLWSVLPMAFSEKIAQHRHHFVDIITTTQDLGCIDVNLRRNIHKLINCKSLFRFPKDDRKKPIIQIITITEKERLLNENNNITWGDSGSSVKLISRF